MSDSNTVQIDADLEDLIPMFMERRRGDIATLRSHLDNSDFEAIRVMGHTLKGTAGGYGFDGLSAIGASLENAAKSSDPTAIAGCADEMETYLNTVQVVYR